MIHTYTLIYVQCTYIYTHIHAYIHTCMHSIYKDFPKERYCTYIVILHELVILHDLFSYLT